MTDITIRSIQATPGDVLIICVDMNNAERGIIDHLPREIARLFPGQPLIIMDSALSLDSVDESAMNQAGWYRGKRQALPKVPPPPPCTQWRERLIGGPVETEQSKLQRARYEGYMAALKDLDGLGDAGPAL